MRLIQHWRKLAPRLWSFRLAILSAILSAIEFALPFLPPLPIPPRTFAALAFVVSVSAAIARLVAQPKAKEDL